MEHVFEQQQLAKSFICVDSMDSYCQDDFLDIFQEVEVILSLAAWDIHNNDLKDTANLQ